MCYSSPTASNFSVVKNEPREMHWTPNSAMVSDQFCSETFVTLSRTSRARSTAVRTCTTCSIRRRTQRMPRTSSRKKSASNGPGWSRTSDSSPPCSRACSLLLSPRTTSSYAAYLKRTRLGSRSSATRLKCAERPTSLKSRRRVDVATGKPRTDFESAARTGSRNSSRNSTS